MATSKLIRIPVPSSTARRLKAKLGRGKTYAEIIDELLEDWESSRPHVREEMARTLKEERGRGAPWETVKKRLRL